MELSDLNIPWLESPFFERLLARSDLDEPTRSLVRTYAADGYLTFDPKIPDFDGVAASILDACARRSDYPLRVTDAWLDIEGVRPLSLAPAGERGGAPPPPRPGGAVAAAHALPARAGPHADAQFRPRDRAAPAQR